MLTWQAPSRLMNPTIPEHVVEQALADDESAATSEWLGTFTVVRKEASDWAARSRSLARAPPTGGQPR